VGLRDDEALTTPGILARDPSWDMWRDGFPRGEAPGQVGAWADRVLSRSRSADGDALAFAHGHLLRLVAARWLQMEPAAGASFGFAPGTVSSLGHERGTDVLTGWNWIPHP
jgi:broad specificity phosphatase PhoE